MSDGEAEGTGVVDRLSPERAFEIVGHETRLAILDALNDADGALSFGDLRRRVGADDPGGFNYHLRQLTDRFVRGTDEGYRLRPPGRRVVGAVLSGALTQSMAAETVPVDGRCTVCQGDLAATFEGDGVRVVCTDCEWVNSGPAVPPAVLADWPTAAAPAAAGRWLKRKSLSAKLGLCPNCDGRLDRRLCLPDDDDAPDWFDGHVSAAVHVADCDRCGHWWHAIAEIAILVEPAVVAFHHEHDVDVIQTPAWELDWLEHGLSSVTSDDPLRVAVPVTLDDETRTFVVDRDVSVADVRFDTGHAP
jgi:hypothetical protein